MRRILVSYIQLVNGSEALKNEHICPYYIFDPSQNVMRQLNAHLLGATLVFQPLGLNSYK